MKKAKQHLLGTLGAMALMGLGLSVLILGQRLLPEMNHTLMVREVTTVALPPPPPPQSVPPTPVATPLAVSVQGQGAALELSLELPEPQPMSLTAPEVQIALSQDWQADLAVDWEAFGLEELDGLPQLLTQVKTAFPAALARKGVNKAVVRLDVFIDESGKPTLVAVADNPHPELQDAINKLVKGSRFSAPTRGGAAVKARFIWPVEFKKS